ncbi:MAG: undecaprenyldiphospho-muramoylpentapeptide beta-N-acetylglucosaminyltransferase [Rhodospirillales bacterium]|nr:undecaprenyldiphospho-muramoylpentapeptide beta-N-acetylglucosaminyltransferase [Rhodospirillales bacterium]
MATTPAPLVVLAAGGTGGHVFPAEALACEMIARGAALMLFTDRRGDAYGGTLGGLDSRTIRAGGIAGMGAGARVRSLADLAFGFAQAWRLLKRLAPRAVVGFGGYASVPTVLAAGVGGINTVIHEQNAVLGRANRVLANRVGRIATSFAEVAAVPAKARGKVVRTGMPVRPAFAQALHRAYAPPAADAPVHLLVLGGSQGARVLGEVVPAAIERLDPGLRRRLVISQQCRPEGLAAAEAVYRRLEVTVDLAPFFDDVPDRLAAAHLVIARAGASTVAELTAVGRPAILVPYPFAIDDHQSANARAAAAGGAAWVVAQDAFDADALAAQLSGLFADPGRLAAAADAARAAGAPDAARRLADLVAEMAGGLPGRAAMTPGTDGPDLGSAEGKGQR